MAQGRIAYRDGDGRWQWTETTDPRAFTQKDADSEQLIGGMFTVTFEDVIGETGVGFDDPDSGTSRRETLENVLLYLSSVLDVPGTADFVVRASQTDGSGALASAGPYLFPMTGFQGGLVYEHLTTGVDPLADDADGTVSVDFGYPWNANTGSPSAIEFDLYSALLHEVTHALGIISIAGSDATSALLNVDGAGLFSLFDALLVRGSLERQLFLAGGEINAVPDDVTSRDLVFSGARSRASLGEFPAVFAPNPFLEGSSIGHWSPDTSSNAVMLPGLNRGVERRTFTEWELQALGDLGYDVIACGDGFIAGAEECDGANSDEEDACDSSCRFTPEPEPDPDPIPPPVPVADAGVPDPMLGAEDPTPSPAPEDPAERPTATASLQSSGGCNVRHPGLGGSSFAILLLLLGVVRGRRSER